MGVTIFVSLYSTRLILASLGAADFGIYTVVGGAIAMLGFLNSTMANATQRFMSYAEGEGMVEKKRAIFNVSLVLHLAVAIATFLLLILAMFPLFDGVFNIQSDRIPAAIIVYFCLIFSAILTIVNVPYDAVMTSHENMLYYSIIGIFEAVLKLGVAFACVYTAHDKLILYGVLMACIPLMTLTIMKVYCHHYYEECVIAPRRYWDKSMLKQIGGFFGWNFLTAISSLFSAQGIGIVLNHFFGTVLNAAQGVAQQVNGALSHFSGNMMKALSPVITKSAGAHDNKAMNRAALAGCKFSTFMTMFFAIPLSLEVNYVLGLWLSEVPVWAALFVVLQLAQTIIVQIADSASIAIYAKGDIKHYAILKSLMNATPLITVWIAFKMGGGPVWLYIPMLIIWGVGGDLVIIYYANCKCGLDVKVYISNVVLPIIGTLFIMLFSGTLPISYMEDGFGRLIFTFLATSIGMFIAGLLFAITNDEKKLLVDVVRRVIKRNK